MWRMSWYMLWLLQDRITYGVSDAHLESISQDAYEMVWDAT